MKFDINIKNIGKIEDANIKLRPFTVISGANSSGKSFVTKALYSFFSTINQDHITRAAQTELFRIRSVARGISYELKSPSQHIENLHDNLIYMLNQLQDMAMKEFGSCTYTEQLSRSYIINDYYNEIRDLVNFILSETRGVKKYSEYRDSVEFIYLRLKQFKKIIDSPTGALISEIEKGFEDGLKENFQVTNLTDLKNINASKESKIKFDFGSLGYIEIEDEDISFRLRNESINDFQSLYNVVFLESPIYWKLRKPLTALKERNSMRAVSFGFRRVKSQLTGVPKYIYDLMDLVEEKFKSNESDQPNIALYHDINKTIGGELDISDNGDILFKEKRRDININLTATGVANLGLIGLLLKRNIIAKGSYIFVDEPEVNLHPAWQKVMVETLHKLSLNGINVVIASHSIDMMKYIENIIESSRENDIEEHFAINQLSNDGTSINDNDHPLKKLASIKADLGASYFDMVLDSDW
ncbi:hypothetical protein VMC_38540 [Vibrio alginolyticus 40B]|nr:hypothetical protein VMC_38540 [Vibrio alginolyticus 40B]